MNWRNVKVVIWYHVWVLVIEIVNFVGQGVDFEKMAIEESRIKYDEWLNTVFWILGGIAFVIALLYMQRYELLENPFYFSSLIFLALVFTRLIKPLSRFIAKKQYPDSFNVWPTINVGILIDFWDF